MSPAMVILLEEGIIDCSLRREVSLNADELDAVNKIDSFFGVAVAHLRYDQQESIAY